ncbi:irregular chiasm C-roughest protein-like isoform X2 [Zootermopsis nevadensis]|uniref:irregular chiasm C-roughest protein-like isoform X2 n=1 Tax=Zootermopsis nevadensis TaxID=136037 RepID=UPI000B8E7079|nr:irregular chiasm C-roughest protein-like isoform X2 [Zootermopsis nevadensis]
MTSVETTAVLAGIARLPCDLQTSGPTDKVTLVIWYKDSGSKPIYSLDARGHSLDQATHWADEQALGGRAFFRVTDADQPAGTHLAVEDVRDTDAGSYRCRVDFQGSPTRNSLVNLTVIVPPRKLAILDENGTNVHQKRVIGPYTEGSTVQITCVATGGRPTPRVTWWRDGIEIDNSDESLSERRVRNVLRLEKLERRHLNTVFTCKASNNDVVSPLTSNVTLDMYHRLCR